MKSVYKVLAYLVALGVVVQAASMVFAVAGLGIWVDEGGVLDKAAFESEDLSFTGFAGFIVHGINGMMIIPVIALVLLIVSFFAKVPGGIKAALLVVVLVALQITLGLSGHSNAYFGMLHGINAFLLLGSALWAARLASRSVVTEPATEGTFAQA